MRPRSPSEVLELLEGSLDAAALAAAIELGLFWLLDEAPRDAPAIAVELGIPPRRCALWLRCVERSGLIEPTAAGYVPTSRARATVLATWSQPTWAFLAGEAMERQAALNDFTRRLLDLVPAPDEATYVTKMATDRDRARRFTRMLGEIHRPLAEDLAATLDLAGVRRVLDLGGGSGVVAMALARRSPALEVDVIDIPTVCEAGRAIVAEAGLEGRVRHVALDLARDPLPAGADLALECDVGLYELGFFRRVREALRPGGRFVVVGDLPRAGDPAPHLAWATVASLRDPDYAPTTRERVVGLLEAAGFTVAAPRALARRPAGDPLPERLTIVEATR